MLVGGQEGDERLGERVLVVADGLDRKNELASLLQAHDRVGPRRPTVDLDEFDVRVQVLQRPPDGRGQRAWRGDGEADREIGQPMDLEGEVIAAAPEALVPAVADRPDDAFKGFLDAIRVREIVAAEAQLPACRGARPAPSIAGPAEQHRGCNEKRCSRSRPQERNRRFDEVRDGGGRGAACVMARRRRPGDRSPMLKSGPGAPDFMRRDVRPCRNTRRNDDEREQEYPEAKGHPHCDPPDA